MQLPYFHVNAFTGQTFGGNPAGVCPLSAWLPDEVMQRMAAEHRLSETAFMVKNSNGAYELRWFTPTVEVVLCGHATLASAHVLWTEGHETSDIITFITKSGPLTATREGNRIALNFPTWNPTPMDMPANTTQAFSIAPLSAWKSRDYLFLFQSEDEVRQLNPDMARLAAWTDALGVIVTAQGKEVDFVSRFFAPGAGVPEDPVTGSAHCSLIPFWSERLGKNQLHARQISERGGDLFCEAQGERVKIAGQALTYFRGTITLGD